MHCKKYIIILILSSFAFLQVQFNRLVPSEYYLGDARSMAIGNTFLSTGKSSMLVISNPAKISQFGNTFYFQSFFTSISERRSMVISDMWGDFLANADYVFNDNTYLKNAFGINYTRSIGKIKLGVGFNYSPFTSFNYSYEEEVRSDADLEDGVIGIDDPIIGYHVINNSGDLYVRSIGLSCSFKNKISIGVGINELGSTLVEDDVSVNIIDDTEYAQNNLSDVDSYNNSHSTEKGSFFTLSINFERDDINVSISFEDNISFGSNSSSTMQISEHLGLPVIFNSNNGELEYNIQGLSYQKPAKYNFGILYKPKYNSDFEIVFETTKRLWNHNVDYAMFLKDNTVEYRFGFEYAPIKSFPIRAGLVYSESPFIILDPKTILTLGTGKKFKNVVLDFALNYNTTSYMYYDLFPNENSLYLSCDEVGCDTVKENNLMLLATLRYDF